VNTNIRIHSIAKFRKDCTATLKVMRETRQGNELTILNYDYHCPYRIYGDAVARTGGCGAYAHDNNGVPRSLREKMRLLKW
jgi:hypothetical protein